MYPACLWSVAPGHDGYSHASVLITAVGLEGQFWVQAEGASLDCSAILLCSCRPGEEKIVAGRRRWLWEVRDAEGVPQAWPKARRLSIAIKLPLATIYTVAPNTAPPMLYVPVCLQPQQLRHCGACASPDCSSKGPMGGFLVGHGPIQIEIRG